MKTLFLGLALSVAFAGTLAAQLIGPGRVFRVPGGGIVSGLVADEEAAPVSGARVQVLRSSHRSGEEQVVLVAVTTTSVDGAFRVEDLAAGRYYVAVWPPASEAGGAATPGSAPIPTGGGLPAAPTYYPEATDPKLADTIRVSHGRETGGLYLRAHRVSTHRVAGTILDSQGQPYGDAIALLNSASGRAVDLSIAMSLVTKVSEATADGSFSFQDVPPGDYRIDVRSRTFFETLARRGGGGIGQPQGADAPEFASIPLRVDNEDQPDIDIRTGRGFRLAGRVTIEGAAEGERASLLGRVRVQALEVGGGPMSRGLLNAGTTVAPDGTFELRDLMGPRMIRISGGPQGLTGWSLKAVRTLTRDVADEGLDMSGDLFDVDVVIARETRIAGVVADRRGEPVAGASVLIFATDRARWAMPLNRYTAEVKSAADGSFEIRGAPAARYYAIAIPGTASGEYDHFSDLMSGATTFSLNDGEPRALRLIIR